MGLDLFELEDAHDLFVEIQSAIDEYHEKPSSRLFLFLVFSLNHLREWIAESSYESIKKKTDNDLPLKPEEEFFWKIWSLEEYKVINRLCNRSKHYLVNTSETTSITEGLHCNGFCTDSLDQKYYLIDGVDSRIIFSSVIREYFNWFQTHG